MKKTMAILMFRLITLASLAFAAVGTAMAQSLVNVGMYAQHYGGKLVYHYRVVNNSANSIAAVSIGHDNKNDNDPNNDVIELLELPSKWNSGTGIPPASATSPPGWRVYVITSEGMPEISIAWETIDDNSPVLLAGQTLNGMSVTLDKADAKYLTSHALVYFTNRYPTRLTVPVERLDTTPPNLTVSLSPNTLWPPNDKLVSVIAAITVEDNYDPAPEIKLESITASEPLASNDIQGAQFGTDDRQFHLVAKRAGSNQTERIYTVTYSATDASGNKATASATVTVPHDQGK